MRVIITGGAGFIGTLLARRLLAGPASIGGADPADVGELVVVDVTAPAADVAADPRTRAVVGDLAEVTGGLGEADVIFHLAGVVSGAAEADFDLGMRVNVDGTRAVLEHARRHTRPPVLVFSSSIAVFGADPAAGVVDVVRDDTLPRPESSYGAQKFIAEQLIADYSRKGFARGRSVRLMTVSVRPGKPNAALSSFMSGMGQPHRDDPAWPDDDPGSHGRRHGPDRRMPRQRPHRLGRRPCDQRDRRELARPVRDAPRARARAVPRGIIRRHRPPVHRAQRPQRGIRALKPAGSRSS
jgi:nucleoside-diphosphate-sugar epimerase